MKPRASWSPRNPPQIMVTLRLGPCFFTFWAPQDEIITWRADQIGFRISWGPKFKTLQTDRVMTLRRYPPDLQTLHAEAWCQVGDACEEKALELVQQGARAVGVWGRGELARLAARLAGLEFGFREEHGLTVIPQPWR